MPLGKTNVLAVASGDSALLLGPYGAQVIRLPSSVDHCLVEAVTVGLCRIYPRRGYYHPHGGISLHRLTRTSAVEISDSGVLIRFDLG